MAQLVRCREAAAIATSVAPPPYEEGPATPTDPVSSAAPSLPPRRESKSDVKVRAIYDFDGQQPGACYPRGRGRKHQSTTLLTALDLGGVQDAARARGPAPAAGRRDHRAEPGRRLVGRHPEWRARLLPGQLRGECVTRLGVLYSMRGGFLLFE